MHRRRADRRRRRRTVVEDSGATSINVLANDTDPDAGALEITAATDPAHGSVAIVQGAPDVVTYAPDAEYCSGAGTDDFTYTVSGGDTATVRDLGDLRRRSRTATASATATTATTTHPHHSHARLATPGRDPHRRRRQRAPAMSATGLAVKRAAIKPASRKLDVLATLSPSASGTVDVAFAAAGRTTRFTVPIAGGQVRVNRAIPAPQASASSGTVDAHLRRRQRHAALLRQAARHAAAAPRSRRSGRPSSRAGSRRPAA